MIRAEEVLCELMREPEYANDVVVHSYVQCWRNGGADAGIVLLQLVKAMSQQKEMLLRDKLKMLQSLPPGFIFEAPPRMVPLCEAKPGDPVYFDVDGELKARTRT